MSFEPNAMMMELFRAEVENHSESLTSCLMALERDPSDASVLESIMRSAHSLKGAARIVGVNIAVDVAHIMEDCLVAAQRGELSIKPSDVDVLLTGVDLLVRISEATKTDDAEWTPIERDVHHCVQQLKSIRAGNFVPQESKQSPSIQQSTEPQREPVNEPESKLVSEKEVSGVVTPLPQHLSSAQQLSSAQPQTTERKQAEPITLTIGKMLDRAHADEIRCALLVAIKSGAEWVRYDLSQTTDLDPTGLAFLAASAQQRQALGLKSLEFDPLSAEMQLVLRMSGILPP